MCVLSGIEKTLLHETTRGDFNLRKAYSLATHQDSETSVLFLPFVVFGNQLDSIFPLRVLS